MQSQLEARGGEVAGLRQLLEGALRPRPDALPKLISLDAVALSAHATARLPPLSGRLAELVGRHKASVSPPRARTGNARYGNASASDPSAGAIPALHGSLAAGAAQDASAEEEEGAHAEQQPQRSGGLGGRWASSQSRVSLPELSVFPKRPSFTTGGAAPTRRHARPLSARVTT